MLELNQKVRELSTADSRIRKTGLRGLDINEIGKESFIHWNGPKLANATSLIEAALDKRFKGRRTWRFVTKENNIQSKVVSRLKADVSRVPFFD